MDAVRVPPDVLRRAATAILQAVDLEPEEASVIAGCLVEANLRGVDSHGVMRLRQYVDALQRAEVNTRPNVRVLRREGATALIDAAGGYGFRPMLMAADLGVALAGQYGIGTVGVRNSHHFGMAALYTDRVAQAVMIGYVTTTSEPVLPPHGAMQPVLGNNPISYAIPRRPPHPPIILDMALSTAAFGKIRLAALEGRPIPPDWALDAAGQPTTDPREALVTRSLAPIGGFKGAGLALISEVLAGVLTGSPFGLQATAHRRREGGVGHLLIAIDIERFIPRVRFYDDLETLVTQVKSAPRAEGSEGVYLPGELEALIAEERRAKGIPLSPPLLAELRALSRQLQVPHIFE
ncbi:MAG: Ldh family oxidoreductase [Armatimonadota bacterium]|nr:Ldh family oxidoreductase [Armatimonadota bacterium]MDR7459961.1 Ldh family oxidoreductase [Armatimonadota bacterium]MDR7575882.1 Ldh family oxidoreductase [Armatimonadota bacterium]MDR7584801.1 Ldh family oxidoreductase [Armatimonadota bacterium]